MAISHQRWREHRDCFLALHKDPNDLDKTRPRDGLGAPSDQAALAILSWQRCSSEHLLPPRPIWRWYAQRARLHNPFNYGGYGAT
jgi:hypothetical protein